MIHDYLINNIEYETTIAKSNIYDIYGALVKMNVCVKDMRNLSNIY